MKTLITQLILIGLLLNSVQLFGQCSLSGYATCEGAEQNNYFVIINATDISSADVVSIDGVSMSKTEGSGQIVFGPYAHSGTGTVNQEVLLNGDACIDILETLCGYYTTNGLHASGSGCVNDDNANSGFILAQSRPGTFSNNADNSQAYILADDMNNYLASNTTGLFEDLASGDYNVFAVNVLTGEASAFENGLSSASDLIDYMNTSTSCSSVCGNVAVNVGCSDSEAKIDPMFEDPCSCTNPLNEFNPDGTILYLHDVVEISQADPSDTWIFRNPTTTFYYQPTPGNFVLVEDGTVIPSVGGGVHSLEIYHTPDVGWASDLFASEGPNSGFEFVGLSNVCTDCDGVQIPTMGQWFLFILALLLLNLGLINLYSSQRRLSEV